MGWNHFAVLSQRLGDLERTRHTLTSDKDFIVIFWNSFETKINPPIEDTLGDSVDKRNFLKYFGDEVEKICKEFSKVTRVKLPEYQELMNLNQEKNLLKKTLRRFWQFETKIFDGRSKPDAVCE